MGSSITTVRGVVGVPGQPSKASHPKATGPAGSVISLKDVTLTLTRPLANLGEVGRQRDLAQGRAHVEGDCSNLGLGGSVISLKDVHP